MNWPQIHDPAIVQDHDGTYYLFGTHRRFAKSDDMVQWQPFDNNLSRDPYSVLGEIWQEWPKQPENPDLLGNTWAPDVIWNDTMQRWCMYMSVNGHQFRSVIVLLTAETLDGDWTYVGPVVYSGFTAENVQKTDVPRVLGAAVGEADLQRYQSLKDTHINAIDAAPIRDEHGNYWMGFGSWFAGLWLIKLDPATGLRDYSTTYPLIHNESDPYYGVKIAGGYWNSGEGTYFVHKNGWWYLFVSYGWLGTTGGYQIRVFRSRELLGPYLDQNGNPAISAGEIPDNLTRDTGIRLMSSVLWKNEPAALDEVEVSQGHNSVLHRRSDGKLFLVYHTRFIKPLPDGEDYYEARIRQLLPTADSWLTAVPYLYQGESAQVPVSRESLIGKWQYVLHDPHTFYNGKPSSDGSSAPYGVNTAQTITLERDGRVTRGGVVSFFDTPDANLPRTTDGPATCGSWQLLGRTFNQISYNVSDASLTLDGVRYVGIFAVVPNEADGSPTLTFSGIGGNKALWAMQEHLE